MIFLYLKWLVAPHPLLTEDEFISAMVGQMLNLGVQTLANRTYFSRRDQLGDYSRY